jgi:hypothetical protein
MFFKQQIDVYSALTMKDLSYLLMFVCFALQSHDADAASTSAGSLEVTVSQRFWSDQRLSRVNGFSQWGALSFDAAAGLGEFAYRIEPYVSFGFIRDTANLPLLNSDGSYLLDSNGNLQDSADDLRYTFFAAGFGVKQRMWSPTFFRVVPFYKIGMIYRYGSVKKLTEAVDEQLKSSGGDLGLEIGGGVVFSFFDDDSLRSDMGQTWDLQDFGMLLQIRYLPGDWFRHGLGLVAGTSGWDFGLGLALDW